MKSFHGSAHGIPLKKQYGQHFLRDHSIINNIINYVDISNGSIFEIGCGDGFLTKAILTKNISLLWVFEIDKHWADYVSVTYKDPRLSMFCENFLDIDFAIFEPNKPWILLANLPYAVTFPILHKLQQNRSLLKEGVIMIQEEVAQKIVKISGRGYGFVSIYFQHYFDWKLLQKVPPSAFYPPPKVDSRILYFKPIKTLDIIPLEEKFWEFIKRCFSQPRRTLRNNLSSFHYNISLLEPHILSLRAEQLSKQDFLKIWDIVRSINGSQ